MIVNKLLTIGILIPLLILIAPNVYASRHLRIHEGIMMDIQTDQTQPQGILLITWPAILLVLIQAMDSIRQPIAMVGLMDTQQLGTLTMDNKVAEIPLGKVAINSLSRVLAAVYLTN